MELSKQYNFKDFEDKINKKWLEGGFFHADETSKKPAFSVLLPPPNITGRLHAGHALNATIQDVLCRLKRMQGFEVLWQPGTDHAAIATEAKVVSKLADEGKTKEGIGREAFNKEIEAWYAQYGKEIIEQFKILGLSLDWERLAFTRDEERNKAVRLAFKALFDKGLIYRGTRLTNWCPNCRTALSDIEVEYAENKGKLYHLRYYLAGSEEKFLTVATTRPETLFGDLAVAVNPKDKRYKSFVGKKVKLPLTGREIPVIADGYVDMEFGTGALKITPSHDANDYEVGARHDLGLLNVFNKDGTLNENAGSFKGFKGAEARSRVVKALKQEGFLAKEEDYANNVGCCERCKTTVEAAVSEQWFIKMDEMAQRALDFVESGKIKIIPERQKQVLTDWLAKTRDWCISRQLWSGHRIPVYTCGNGHIFASVEEPEVCKECGSRELTQDPDVLDTWFSSGLWPMSTLNWQNEGRTALMEKFYPFDALVTAYDIVFFWCARMIFFAGEFTGEIPFKTLYFNGLVRDGQGRKFSKNLGNGIDPQDVVAEYGADALRFSLIYGIALGGDVRFSDDKVILARNFINKLWNASRFVMMNIDKEVLSKPVDSGLLRVDVSERWILQELGLLKDRLSKAHDKLDFGLALAHLYEFTWNKFCDFYIEFSKPVLSGSDENKKQDTSRVLKYVLSEILKLLHPYIPFITEEIYSALEPEKGMLIATPYGDEYFKNIYDSCLEEEMEACLDLIKQVRNLRTQNNINPKTVLCTLLKETDKKAAWINAAKTKEYLDNLCTMDIKETNEKPDAAEFLEFGCRYYKLYIEKSQTINKEQEAARLTAEIAKLTAEIDKKEGLLNNAGFIARAPAAVSEGYKKELAGLKQKRISAQTSLKNL